MNEVYATELKCTSCGSHYANDETIPICPKCQGLLEVEYDFESMKNGFKKDDIAKSAMAGLWRYAKVLPIHPQSVVTLGEGFTPLLQAKKIAPEIKLMLKLDYITPTSSFKDRGSTIVISKAKELKVSTVAIDSTGNAAASVSAYAAKARITCYVFIPDSTENDKVVQVSTTDATVIKVRGTRQDTHDVIEAAYRKFGWYYCGFMVSPYAIEGTKTIAYEICEQLNWNPPDWIVFPVGTGSGIVGCYKGLQELHKLGWINQMPKLVCIQAEGCAPIAGAHKQGLSDILPVRSPDTVAEGLAVGAPPKGKLALEALKKTGGHAEVVSDKETLDMSSRLASEEGLFVEISSAPSVAGVLKLMKMGIIDKGETVACELTGTGLKSSAEYARMARPTYEIEPNLDSLLKTLKI
jgi:threonine synthase